MKIQRLLALVAIILLCPTTLALAAPSASDASKTHPKFLQGGVTSFGKLTDELQARIGIQCTRDYQGTIRIETVRTGTEAYWKGLRPGDAVLNARADSTQAFVTINRDGRIYQASLNTSGHNPRLVSQSPAADKINQPRGLKGRTEDQKVIETLSKYNFEIIIDRSMSMTIPDCPGRLSRWDWCGNQAVDIARGLSRYSADGLTITRFARQFDVDEHASVPRVVDLLSRHDFQFGTQLSEPLAARLDRFLSKHRSGDKPLLIAVITDGEPRPLPQPTMVIETLIKASQRMKGPGEVTVVFLQVGGDDPWGRQYLQSLATNLVKNGARYPYVRVKTFEELLDVGLAQALVEAVEQYAQPGTAQQLPGAHVALRR